MGWTTPATWDYKERPGSDKMNEQIRDNLAYLKTTVPPGVMFFYGGSSAPELFLICDGSAISRSTYADLFAIIGTSYGEGDGSSTFNLPDLRGKVPIGLQSTDADFDTLGETGGEKEHTLTENEMPGHVHSIFCQFGTASSNRGPDVVSGNYAGTGASVGDTNSTGGGNAHNNLQPYLIGNWIIKAL